MPRVMFQQFIPTGINVRIPAYVLYLIFTKKKGTPSQLNFPLKEKGGHMARLSLFPELKKGLDEAFFHT